jgi:hypothetical protein
MHLLKIHSGGRLSRLNGIPVEKNNILFSGINSPPPVIRTRIKSSVLPDGPFFEGVKWKCMCLKFILEGGIPGGWNSCREKYTFLGHKLPPPAIRNLSKIPSVT